MALHIDLYHELRAENRARKRDPLKIAMLGLLLVALGLIGYYGVRLKQVSTVRTKGAEMENEWKVMGDKQEKAKARETELNALLKTTDLLVDRIEKRFYWAPVLGQFLTTVPREVQIVKFEGDATADGSKKCAITLQGVSTGTEPRTAAEILRTNLAGDFGQRFPKATATFKALEDSNDTVVVDGHKRAAALFTSNLDLPKPGAAAAAVGARTAANAAPKKR